MNRSETIKSLAAAFVKAQRQVEGARKDSANPYFKSKYADLGSVWDACREALQANGLAVAQFPIASEAGVGVETVLLHESGEWMGEKLILPFPVGKDGVSKEDAQAGGSCITYARRYALAAIMGVCPEDDDGNAAADASRRLREKAVRLLEPEAKKGLSSYKAAWQTLSPDMRQAVGVKQHEAFVGMARDVKENGHATAAV